MTTIRKTKKLKGAVQVLCDEGFSDTSEQTWFEALKTRKITSRNIYRTMAAYGMKWDPVQGCWYTRARRMPFVKTMFSVVRKIDDTFDI